MRLSLTIECYHEDIPRVSVVKTVEINGIYVRKKLSMTDARTMYPYTNMTFCKPAGYLTTNFFPPRIYIPGASCASAGMRTPCRL